MAFDISTLTSLLAEFGVGALAGGLLTYVLKKLFNLIVQILTFAFALFVLGLTWLASQGVITVNWPVLWTLIQTDLTGLYSMAQNLASSNAGSSALSYITNLLPSLGAAGIGVIIGFLAMFRKK